jgi:hypothetical protein
MASMNLAVFSDQDDAEDAIAELERSGFNPKELSVVMKDSGQARAVAQDTGASVAEGMASGITTGGVLGGIAGLLIGIGAISIPGIGALLIAGPLASALGLTGAAASTVSGAVTGAVAGGVVGGLVGIGVPKETAQVYEDRIRDGGILLAVPTQEGKGDYIRSVLSSHDATDIQTVNVKD